MLWFANGQWNCVDIQCSSRVSPGTFQPNYECAEVRLSLACAVLCVARWRPPRCSLVAEALSASCVSVLTLLLVRISLHRPRQRTVQARCICSTELLRQLLWCGRLIFLPLVTKSALGEQATTCSWSLVSLSSSSTTVSLSDPQVSSADLCRMAQYRHQPQLSEARLRCAW